MTQPPEEAPRFGPQDVAEISSHLAEDDATFLIGGQATNLWAWIYGGRHPDLSSAQPITSVDIDYFGHAKAAEALATALGGENDVRLDARYRQISLTNMIARLERDRRRLAERSD